MPELSAQLQDIRRVSAMDRRSSGKGPKARRGPALRTSHPSSSDLADRPRDKELHLQGRRSESRGLGIGAFSYYRRVVENQKGRIIAEIAKAAKKLGANSDVLRRFEAAVKETQFSKAIDEIKDGIPPVLLIDGQHNTLTLLHSALSEGLHADTDAECLELAKDIRLVLTELADRLSQALKEHAELKDAVTRLLTRRSGTATPAPNETAPESAST